jgi:hypothetical protein
LMNFWNFFSCILGIFHEKLRLKSCWSLGLCLSLNLREKLLKKQFKKINL